MSAEPSMEEILSSIKRIIAEEGDPPGRARRMARAVVPQPVADDADDQPGVLELDTPVPAPSRSAEAAPAPTAEPARIAESPRAAESSRAAEPPRPTETPRQVVPDQVNGEAILSRETAEASRGSLDILSRLIVRPEAGGDGTLEGLVREMLRPMLREWLDTNLPGMVETMVAREIAKITGQV